MYPIMALKNFFSYTITLSEYFNGTMRQYVRWAAIFLKILDDIYSAILNKMSWGERRGEARCAG